MTFEAKTDPGPGFLRRSRCALPGAVAVLLPLLFLAACGGKGPSGSTPSPSPDAVPPFAGAVPATGSPSASRSGNEPFTPVSAPAGAAPSDAPRVTALRLIPDPSRPTGLGVEVQGTAPRGKGIDYEYAWTRNGEDGGKGKFLEGAAKRGDTLRVTVRPYDADGFGAPVSIERDVTNVPPAVGNPVEVSFDGSVWSARVPATDGDGDPLSFRLKEGPPGMTVDGEGRVRWPVPAGYAGTASATVVVTDGAGGETAGTFRVTIRNG